MQHLYITTGFKMPLFRIKESYKTARISCQHKAGMDQTFSIVEVTHIHYSWAPFAPPVPSGYNDYFCGIMNIWNSSTRCQRTMKNTPLFQAVLAGAPVPGFSLPLIFISKFFVFCCHSLMFLTLLQHFVLLCLENLLQLFQLHFLFQQLIVPAKTKFAE